MIKNKIRAVSAAVLLVVTIAAGTAEPAMGAGAVPSMAKADSTPVEYAEQWARTLAKEDAFAEWRGATIEVEPLGPGTHSWLAVVNDRKHRVGYMIISAAEQGGYLLTEYGTGDNPPYGETALRAAAAIYGFRPSAAVRRYAGPFTAVWRAVRGNGEVVYLDAGTGERIESLNDRTWRKAAATGGKNARANGSEAAEKSAGLPALPSNRKPELAAGAFVAPFDPYGRLPWITGTPLAIARFDRDLAPLLQQRREVRLTVEPYGPSYMAVWAVAGCHRWGDGSVMLGLHQGKGLRFIGFDEVLLRGRLYV